jgi:hypothetical protein
MICIPDVLKEFSTCKLDYFFAGEMVSCFFFVVYEIVNIGSTVCAVRLWWEWSKRCAEKKDMARKGGE